MPPITERVTYQDLTALYGKTVAASLLRTVERLAQIQSEIIHLDENIRLQKALDALNDINFAL